MIILHKVPNKIVLWTFQSSIFASGRLWKKSLWNLSMLQDICCCQLAVDWLPLLLLAQQNPVLIDWLGSILIDPKCQYITPSISFIGYGHSTPKTDGGKVFTMIYAIIGIPIGLVMFNSIGERFNYFSSMIINKCRKMLKAKQEETTEMDLICIGSTLTVIIFTSGAAAFSYYEGKSLRLWLPILRALNIKYTLSQSDMIDIGCVFS